jgi:CelD/BcsL family acetyltransferase involved in cellulose biosynthesis
MEATVRWQDKGAWDGAFEQEWSDLVDRCPTASIFQTPEWVSAWWKHFGTGRLVVLTVHHDKRLICLAPFVAGSEKRFGVTLQTLSLAGEPMADRLGLLFDPAFDGLSTAARAVVEQLRSFDLVRMAELTMHGPEETALLGEARRVHAPMAIRVWSRAPVLRLERSWEEIERSYPRALRTRLSRARAKQKQAGEWSFRRWQPAPPELGPLLEAFRGLEDRSWKGESRVGIFSTARSRDFVRDVSEKFARRGWLDVASVTANGALVAYRYGFRFRGVFLDYNLAHDPAYARMAPGRILLDDIIRDSHRMGLSAVDASRGRIDPPHLLADWTSESRLHSLVLLFGPSLRGRAMSSVERTFKPIARRLLRRKPLTPAVAEGAGR